MYLQLKVTLNNVKPAVWRRIVVSDEITLFQLHNSIQIAFNWTNTHLYCFDICGYNIDTDGGLGPGETLEELNVKENKLKDFPLHEKDHFQYTYDFGDDWKHKLTVEKITELGPEHPTCLAGKRNAPPEDCGGPWGYESLMGKKAKNKLSKDEKEWLEGYDPEYFDLEEINDLYSDGESIDMEEFF